MNIYCCACEIDVDARLTTGEEVYPHRADLHSLPFWKCDAECEYYGEIGGYSVNRELGAGIPNATCAKD